MHLRVADTSLESGSQRARSRGLVLLALCAAALIINIELTIVNVALPSLVRELGATTTNLQWVVDAYTLVFAALILGAGSLSDRVGRKGVLLLGLGVFAAGSLVAALSQNPAQLIAARAVMGAGAAGIFPSTLSIIANVFTGRAERAKAIGLWGATTGVGVAGGPIVGGWLLNNFWWGSVFAFMVLVAAVVAALVAFLVPSSNEPEVPPLDWVGFGLSSAGMGTLVFGIIQAPSWGWRSPSTIATLVGGLILLGAFINSERRNDHPMLDVRLFRNLRFTAASGSITIAFFALAGFSFLMTQYFQFVKGYSPLGTGVRLLPVACSIAVAAVAGTKLAVRVGNKAVVATGLVLLGCGVLWISTAAASTSYLTLVTAMLFGGGGLGMVTAPATEAIIGAVPTDKAGIGSAVNDATRLFGAALGVAVVGSVAASIYLDRLSGTLPAGLTQQAIGTAKSSIGSALVASRALQGVGLSDPARTLRTAATEAFMHSFAGGLRVAGCVALVGAIIAAKLLPSRPQAAPPDLLSDVGSIVTPPSPEHRPLHVALASRAQPSTLTVSRPSSREARMHYRRAGGPGRLLVLMCAVLLLAGAPLASAQATDEPSTQPRPIPGGLGVVPGTPVGYHVNPPGYSPTNPSMLDEQSSITDFDGTVGSTDVQGTGTATDTRTGLRYPLAFDADMRFMQGRYIGYDGRSHHATFGFI